LDQRGPTLQDLRGKSPGEKECQLNRTFRIPWDSI
jgi:hypothetical protein